MSEPETEGAPQTPKKKGRSKLLTLGLPLLVLLSAGGGGGWWYFSQQTAAAAAAEPVEVHEPEPSGMLPLPVFIVNLADPGSRKYLRAAVVLLLPDEDAAAEVEENKLTITRLRSAIFEVLTAKTSSELSTPEGRNALKAAILEAARGIDHLDVRDVLFEEFLVQ